ncbi:hypothetical protein KY289_024123 [Solanum tuberosum]|nr:hypothetical protein KY289_024123 [Solanum tuberosum]
MGWVKCNTDGTSRGNPGESSYSFCIRNNEGDLLYAEAQNIRQGTSMEAEIRDSLSLTKMIQREWKVPWSHIEDIEDIQVLLRETNARVNHIFRKANQLADSLANEAFRQNNRTKWHNFQQLPSKCRKILNADKSNIPTIRIKARKIIAQVR